MKLSSIGTPRPGRKSQNTRRSTSSVVAEKAGVVPNQSPNAENNGHLVSINCLPAILSRHDPKWPASGPSNTVYGVQCPSNDADSKCCTACFQLFSPQNRSVSGLLPHVSAIRLRSPRTVCPAAWGGSWGPSINGLPFCARSFCKRVNKI